MNRWTTVAAAAAIGTAILLANAGGARAQGLPEPEPVGNVGPMQSPAVPGPMPRQMAPVGPPPDLALPATVPTAWGLGPRPEEACYFHIGAQAYQRQDPGGSIWLLRDNTTNLDRGTTPLLRNTSNVATFNDTNPGMDWGVRATLGYLFDAAAIELTGFYIPNQSSSITATIPGRLTMFFNNPPVGFEGDNGMWLQSDRAKAIQSTALASGELNYKWWSRSFAGVEGILGVRYMDVQDAMSIYSGDDDVTVLDINGFPDPNRQATYMARAHNHIVAPQLGFDATLPCNKWFQFGLMAKGAWGVNFVDVNTRLTRGDGFTGLKSNASTVGFGQVYEVGAYLDLLILERLKLRGGYNCLWAGNVAEGVDNLNYDLSQQPGSLKHDGNIFYHGPLVELQFLF